MLKLLRALLLTLAALCAAPAMADDGDGLQCVPYARQLSGIQIYGDAHTWWGQAAGRFKRGRMPQVDAVLAFKPHGVMRLGHVAAVSKIIDSRTILISHSNWSTINGRRGQIENNVEVIDVSRDNDWSRVRVWYTPIGGLGTTLYPVHGFIYSGAAPKESRPPQFQMAGADIPARASGRQAVGGAAQGDPIGDLLVQLGR